MSTPSNTAINDYLHTLSRHVAGEVRSDAFSRMFYSTDASIYQQMPHGVLIPKSAEDIHAAVELATTYKMPILARGGGTSLAGQCVNEALVIDAVKHLNRILEINVAERWVRVEPGVVLDDLNRALKPHGLKYGPDPASSSRAVVGGIVSNNSSGAHSILYGMSADHVIETRVVLHDGSSALFGPKSTHDLLQYQTRSDSEATLYQQMAALTYNERNRSIIAAGTSRHWRRCGGYNLDRFVNGEGVSFQWPHDPTFNLARLLCGAEGTLGVITEVKLGLVEIPAHSALAVVHFDDLRTALNAVPQMLETEPSAIELVDNFGLTRARMVPEYARQMRGFIEGEPFCILITEYYGESESDLQAKIGRLQAHLRRHKVPVSAMTTAFSTEQQATVWNVRKVSLGFLMGLKGDVKPLPFIEDAAVPVEHLPDYIDRLERFCKSIDTPIAYYAHASAGCLHVRPLINAKVAADINKMPDIIRFAMELLGEYGGALSSEHGDGKSRSWANERFFGADLYGLYKEVKGIFDPHNLFNPGNIVDGPDMRHNLRFGDIYHSIDISEQLDFSADMGFARAVEMCNGAGVCRKPDGGTMCPPYMVTLEEEASTRGRANALRAALSGVLPPEALTSERMYEVLALCVGCKACKAECPSSVDMARIKTEFLNHYQAANGTPLRSRVFAHIGRINQLGSRFAALANWTLSNPLSKRLIAKQLSVAPERDLPQFAKKPFPRWFQRRTPTAAPDAPRVVLLTDTYSNYNYPEVAIAAVEVLEALGFRIALSTQTCVGRPALSKGMVAAARRYAQETLAVLAPFARQGLAIVGLEPSDVSAITDDYAALLPNDPRVPLVAAQTQTFEEFVAGIMAAGDMAGVFVNRQKSVLLHGHCHQKALIGTQPIHRILQQLGHSVVEVDSGCCGMAGSFGYEAEHYDISLQMAQRKLLPAVASQAADTLIVAAGVSCRQQIKHGSGRRALHPAEVLQQALAS